MDKISRLDLQKKKDRGERIVVVTAYDWSMARLLDRAGVDALLVGDSLGMVVQGHESTLPVTLDQMVYHCACVTRAKPRAQVVADLPFGTFQRGRRAALDASLRLVQESGAEAVKIEGAGARLRTIEAVAQADIPVWGHLGLTPQSIHRLGGYKVQGKQPDEARLLVDAARKVEAAGACAMVLECIPSELSKEITAAVRIPTIGIGAGVDCDGQVLVIHDLLGFYEDFVPRFVKQYADLGTAIEAAVRSYAEEVREGRFPTPAHSYGSHAERLKGAQER